MTVAVRPARADDEAFVLALTPRLAAFAVPAWRTPAEIAAADHELLVRALRAGDPGTLLLVAEEGGERLGYLCATTREDYFTHRPHAHVEVLALDERAQGRGAARALVEYACGATFCIAMSALRVRCSPVPYTTR